MRRRKKRNEDDGDLTAAVDLFAGFSGIAFLLFLVALIVMGHPKVTWSALNKERQGRISAEKTAQKGKSVSNRRKKMIKNLKDKAKSLAGEVQQGKSKIGQMESAIKGLEHQIGGLKSKIKDIENQPRRAVDLVIAVDGSGSMAAVHDELRSCIDSLATVGTAILPRFRLGVIVYREDVMVFPLREMDESGKQAWRRFAYEATHRFEINQDVNYHSGYYEMHPAFSSIPSRAAIDQGIRSALHELARGDHDARRILVVAGDVGPWEQEGSMDVIDEGEWRRAGEITNEVQRFLRNPGTSILAIFSGRTPEMHLQNETSDFLKRLVGTSGTYSEQPSEISKEVMRASLVE